MLNLHASRWREDRGGGDEGRIGRSAVTLITESVSVVRGLEEGRHAHLHESAIQEGIGRKIGRISMTLITESVPVGTRVGEGV